MNTLPSWARSRLSAPRARATHFQPPVMDGDARWLVATSSSSLHPPRSGGVLFAICSAYPWAGLSPAGVATPLQLKLINESRGKLVTPPHRAAAEENQRHWKSLSIGISFWFPNAFLCPLASSLGQGGGTEERRNEGLCRCLSFKEVLIYLLLSFGRCGCPRGVKTKRKQSSVINCHR